MAASLLDCSGHLGEGEIRGLWTPAEARFHINLLELQGIRLTLKAFLPSIKGERVQVLTDYTIVMWYCNKQSVVWLLPLCQEALCLWNSLGH